MSIFIYLLKFQSQIHFLSLLKLKSQQLDVVYCDIRITDTTSSYQSSNSFLSVKRNTGRGIRAYEQHISAH